MGINTANELYKSISQHIAVLLTRMGVTEQPILLSVENDSGIFEGTSRNHLTNPLITGYWKISPDIYIKLCGMHMVGSGMYVCYMQDKLKKSAADFTLEEINFIAKNWESKDAYELALNTFGIPLQSQQKASLDQVYIYGLGAYKISVDDGLNKPENLRAYMKVMYDAGFTVGASMLG